MAATSEGKSERLEKFCNLPEVAEMLCLRRKLAPAAFASVHIVVVIRAGSVPGSLSNRLFKTSAA